MTPPAPRPLEVALFRDATETAFRLADQLHARDPAFPAPPRRHGVTDADEIHHRLLSGRNPIAAMSLDDAIALRQGPDPAGRDLAVLAGVHRGFLELMVRPELEALPALRGWRVGIDTDTGYARALFALLRRAGLEPGRDLAVVRAGATDRRYGRLLAGELDATLLGAPFTVLAKARGFRALGSVPQLLGGYQGVVLLARSGWLQAHADQARAMVESLLGAMRWALDPSHRPALIPMLQRSVAGADDPALAERIATGLFGPASQFLADGRIAASDAAVVVELYNRDQSPPVNLEEVLAWIGGAGRPG